MNKTELNRRVIAQVRNEIVQILTTRPGQTIEEITSKLTVTMSTSFIQGVIGLMRSLAIIHPSGEVRKGSVYATRFSLGATGTFTKSPERIAKKPPRIRSLERKVVYTPPVKKIVKKKTTVTPIGDRWLATLLG